MPNELLACGDCGRIVHRHKGTTSGYRHAPVTKAKPEWDQPCTTKPPINVYKVGISPNG